MVDAVDNLRDVIGRIERSLKSRVSERDKFQRELARRLGKAWDGELAELMKYVGDPPNLSNVPESYWNNGGKKLRAAVTPVFEEIYVAQATRFYNDARIVVDWMTTNQRAVDWAGQHAGELIKQWGKTNRDTLIDYIQKYYQNDWTRQDLIDRLSPLFGERRARTIAITETTNAAVQSERECVRDLQSKGFEFKETWRVSENEADRSHCDCESKDGKPCSEVGYPPEHINCECYVEYERVE